MKHYITPSVGDMVEFDSDKQTEKGPSSGSVVDTNNDLGTFCVKHSDTEEYFNINDMKIKKFTRDRLDRPLWIFE